MRIYEMVTILKPQLSDAEIADFITETKKLIASEGGEIVSEDKLGRRKLTHEIRHVRDGYYVYMRLKAEPKMLAVLNKNLKVKDSVLRSISVRGIEKEAVKPAPAAAK